MYTAYGLGVAEQPVVVYILQINITILNKYKTKLKNYYRSVNLAMTSH